MKIERKLKRSYNSEDLKQKKHRPVKRYVSEAKQTCYTDITDKLNNPEIFTYNDINRNQGLIELYKKQFDEVIRNYGVDLQYFRKYNTFFEEDETKHTANMTYGEDTVAEFYASGMIRAFLDIESYDWQFNNMGFENLDQITIYIGIDNFREKFIPDIGVSTTKYFEVPVSGNLINNEISGLIDCPEFYASIYAEINSLNVDGVVPEICSRPTSISFYNSAKYETKQYPLSGSLSGTLVEDDCIPYQISGVLAGELTYYCKENKENSPLWGIAPQVGDFFRFKMGEIEEEYEVNQLFDRILTNKSGINPALGKYVFRCSAVKRQSSYEEIKENQPSYEPGSDIDKMFSNTEEDINELVGSFVKDNPKTGKKIQNEITNKVAKNIFEYEDKSDITYGGYENSPKRQK